MRRSIASALVAFAIGCSHTFIELNPDDDADAAFDSVDSMPDFDPGEVEFVSEGPDSAHEIAPPEDTAAEEDTPEPDAYDESTEPETESTDTEETPDADDVPAEVEPEADAMDSDEWTDSESDSLPPDDSAVGDSPIEESIEDILAEEAEPEDSGPETPLPTIVCSDWDLPGTTIEPFVAASYLWPGTVAPRRNTNWIQITDQAASFLIEGSWTRVVANYTLVIPGVSPLPPSMCERHIWHSGGGDFIAEYAPVTHRFISLDGTAAWAPAVVVSVEEERVCDPMSGVGWSEFRVDGRVAVRTDSTECDPIVLFAMVVAPGYLAECGSTIPVLPARPLVTYSPLVLRSFCFVGEP